MERRGFLKLSGTTAAAIVIAPSLITETLRAEDGSLYKSYDKIMLKDADGKPLKAANLVKEENYVFNFPHVATPCILVQLDGATEKSTTLKADDGTEYTFKGGLGKDNSIVAYSAICPHQLTHPQPDTSFFQYVPTGTKTLAYDKAVGGVFVCSSHLSAFTPKDGGRRVTGPATEGLTQIVLEIDENDVIWAVGALGPNKFHEYLKAFKGEFKKYYGNKRKAKKLVKTEAQVVTLKNFSKDIQQF
ncbi:MAG: Ubiquinol-cytochrome C reductase iron-sulfur subunit (EC [uncultured Sulfurovum sp.]|uniref:Ubiquinol-cytochrome C reductase iron-sulfur subunit (EC) n=1 Tax=uncultured Sulfurovum sp. TaxID=269237 RepID=A0A6S6U496_9BACT|nr:MAG: Ubiquinol-cytochrome C reductase iron-sulfur subunit (EC [uncultured Sulfurovum sp.]